MMTKETKTAASAATTRDFVNGKISLMQLSGGHGQGYGGSAVVPRLLPKVQIRLIQNHAKQGDNSPDYWVESPYVDESGPYWERAGAAWIKTPKMGGDDFLSINIDLADLDTDVNLAAFPVDDEDQPKEWVKGEPPIDWRIVYNRPRRNASARTGSASSGAQSGGAAQLNDEIPY